MFRRPQPEPTEKVIFFFILTIYLIGIFLSRWDFDFFRHSFINEDGPVEWLTVIGLISAAGFTTYRALKSRKKKQNTKALLNVVLAFGLLFVAGEEISWGQRIFQIESKEYFVQNNTQGEMNIHNLKIASIKINKLIFSLVLFIIVSLYLLTIPFLYGLNYKAREFINKHGLLVPKPFHILGFILFYLLAELIPIGKKAELVEMASVFLFLMLLMYPLNRKATYGND